MGNIQSSDRVNQLIDEFEDCLAYFYHSQIFSGPSLYFHRKVLKEREKYINIEEALQSDLLFDYLYATLASWGMHRMGNNNAKLCDMDRMRKSIESQVINIGAIQKYTIQTIPNNEINQISHEIWNIISHLEIGIGDVKIVAGSKALHHLLPELVPPIDREYTLRFFYNNKNINNRTDEANKFQEIFSWYTCIAKRISTPIANTVELGGGMNTSTTKVIDNAIVGFVLKYLKNTPKNKKENQEKLQISQEYSTRLVSPESHAAQIYRAALALVNSGNTTFTRDDVRRYLDLSSEEFQNGYTAIFQGMRIDHPGGAPKVGKAYRGVFRQIKRGVYELVKKD